MADTNPIPLSLKLIRFMYNRLGPVFPEYFGKLAYEMWFRTTRFKTPDRELEVLKNATISTIDVHGMPITTYCWAHVESDQPVVLFIHGWSGRGTQVSAFVKPLTDAGIKVISFDGPAHGKSPGKQTSVLQFADAVLALQKSNGPFHGVITHSLGGMILAFTMQFKFTTDKAVCICPTMDFDRIISNFAAALALPDKVLAVMLNKFQATHGNLIRDMISTVDNVSNINCPALIIHDKDDPELPWQGSEKIHQAWKGSKLMLTEGLKHHRIVHDETVVKAALDFLAGAEN